MRKLLKLFKRLFCNKCHLCENGYIKYIGEDYTGRVWINIYQCDNCKEKFL